MTSESDAPETIFDLVADMESEICNVEDWAKAFQAVASSRERVDPEAIFVMANALEELGGRLKLRYRRAVELAQKLEANSRSVP